MADDKKDCIISNFVTLSICLCLNYSGGFKREKNISIRGHKKELRSTGDGGDGVRSFSRSLAFTNQEPSYGSLMDCWRSLSYTRNLYAKLE